MLLLAISFIGAQETQPPKPSKADESREAPLFAKAKPTKYKVWVYLNDSPKVENGFLYKVGDSSILVSNTFKVLDNPKFTTEEFPISRIEKIKFAEHGRLGNSIIVGATVGMIVGFIIGKQSTEGEQQACDDAGGWFCGLEGLDNLAGGVAIGTVVGMGGGAVVGNNNTFFTLKGNMEFYNHYKEQISKYVLIY